MRILRLVLEQQPLQSSQSFTFDRGYNECTLRHGLHPEDLVDAVACALFPPALEVLGLSSCRIEVESFEKKTSLHFSEGQDADSSAAENALQGTVLRSREGLTDLFFCSPGKVSDQKKQQLKEHPQMRRLESLRKALEMHRAIDEINEKLDRAHHRVFEIHEHLKRFREPKKRLAQLALEYEDVKAIDQVKISESMVSTLRTYSKTEEQFIEETFAMNEAIDQAQERIDMHDHRDWYMQKESWIGAAVCVLAFLSASALRENVWVFYSGLLTSILACSLIVYAVFKSHRQDEEQIILKASLRDAQQKRAAAYKKRDADTLSIRQLFEAVGSSDPSEVLQMLSKSREIQKERIEIEKNMAALSTSGTPKDLEIEQAALEASVKEMEKKLSSFPPLSTEIHSIEIEIENLEKLLGVDATSVFSVQENQNTLIEDLIDLASEAAGIEREKLIPVLLKGVEKNILPITHGTVSTMLREDSGWLFQAGTRFLPLQEFNDVQKQAIVFAVQFTLWQMLAHRFPFFCFVDASGVLHPSLRKTVLQACKHLAQKAQVIILE